ncbi:hypothetical protein F4861DRAFT_515390 [Xylaria intraflava]|nr:hypothetical protein F4861DRAFT_515390 [Xylaria intraflava]
MVLRHMIAFAIVGNQDGGCTGQPFMSQITGTGDLFPTDDFCSRPGWIVCPVFCTNTCKIRRLPHTGAPAVARVLTNGEICRPVKPCLLVES